MILAITAALQSSNITVFRVVDYRGVPVNLDALGAVRVQAQVCGPLGTAEVEALSFTAEVVRVQFGKLVLTPRQFPYPIKVSYTTADGGTEVIAGPGYTTEIDLRMVC